jgi:hypothetical protein
MTECLALLFRIREPLGSSPEYPERLFPCGFNYVHKKIMRQSLNPSCSHIRSPIFISQIINPFHGWSAAKIVQMDRRSI